MTTRVGVIGTGTIGHDHVRRLTEVVARAEVVAVTDVDPARAAQVAATAPGARWHDSGRQLIDDPAVDAVLVASWGPTHEAYVLDCLRAGKPVLCEKPLATTRAACRRIVDAEVALGRRLVQVGYMRRYDPAYRALRDVVRSGAIGAPLLMHARHRNPAVPEHWTPDMAITDTAVHDVDVVRWLLGEEVVSAAVRTPRRNRRGGDLQDPLLLLFETESGVVVDVETSVNIRYGYDVGGEVVGEDGTAALADTAAVIVRREGTFAGGVPGGWRERFAQAYEVELQAWVDDVAAGADVSGPNAWDGYAAAAVSDAAVAALHDGTTEPVVLSARPQLYADRADGPRP